MQYLRGSIRRTRVLDAVRRLQIQHDSMEFFGARANLPIETCLAEVRRSDVLIVIVGHRYGNLAPELGVSFSEAEYREGQRLGKPSLVYLRDDDVPVLPRHIERDPEKMRLLDNWKEALTTRHTVAKFSDAQHLAVQVAADLSRTIQALEEAERPRNGYEHATVSALAILGTPNPTAPLAVRYVETPGELHTLWRIDDDAYYGRASISYETFEGWWSAYPHGLRALFAGPDVVGAVGIWPISKQWASSFCSGTCREEELPRSALGYYRSRQATSWYISGIVLASHLRETKAIRILLEQGLQLWTHHERCAFPLELLALAYSNQGEALLRRFDFTLVRTAKQTPDGFPLYRRRFDARTEMIDAFAKRGLMLERQ